MTSNSNYCTEFLDHQARPSDPHSKQPDRPHSSKVVQSKRSRRDERRDRRSNSRSRNKSRSWNWSRKAFTSNTSSRNKNIRIQPLSNILPLIRQSNSSRIVPSGSFLLPIFASHRCFTWRTWQRVNSGVGMAAVRHTEERNSGGDGWSEGEETTKVSDSRLPTGFKFDWSPQRCPLYIFLSSSACVASFRFRDCVWSCFCGNHLRLN